MAAPSGVWSNETSVFWAQECRAPGDMHEPAAQAYPAGQALPHAPQLLGSDWSDTHTPLQSACAGLHEGSGPHEPLVHTSGCPASLLPHGVPFASGLLEQAPVALLHVAE
jgi:hypothetical protein